MTRKNLYRFLAYFYLINSLFIWLNGLFYSIRDSFLNFSALNLTYKFYLLGYFITTYLSYLNLFALIPILIALFVTIALPRQWLIIPLIVILSSLSQALLNIDIYCFNQFRFHFQGILLWMLFSGRPADMFGLGTTEIAWSIAGILFIILIYSMVAYWIRKKIDLEKPCTILICFIGSLFVFWCASILAISSQSSKKSAFRVYTAAVRSIPYYNYFLAYVTQKGNFNALYHVGDGYLLQPGQAYFKLNYPLKPLNCPINHKPKNLLVIMIDTWRFDVLKKNIMPATYAFSKESSQFTNHLSGGNSTRAGVFSFFYGLPSTYWTAVENNAQPPLLIQEIQKHNYDTAVFASGGLTLPEFNKTVFVSIPNLIVKTEGQDPVARDKKITKDFLAFLHNKNPKKPFFGFVFYDAAHSYCLAKGLPNRFSPAIAECKRGSKAPDTKTYFNRYKDALYFVDQQISQILNELEHQNLLKNTIIVITGDHGEEFNDNNNNYFGHASNYTRYQVQTPLILHMPNQTPAIYSHKTTHYDIAPVLLKSLFSCKNPSTDYALGFGLFDNRERAYTIVCSYTDFGIVESQRLTRVFSLGDYQIQDLNATPQPNLQLDTNIMADVMKDLQRYYQK